MVKTTFCLICFYIGLIQVQTNKEPSSRDVIKLDAYEIAVNIEIQKHAGQRRDFVHPDMPTDLNTGITGVSFFARRKHKHHFDRRNSLLRKNKKRENFKINLKRKSQDLHLKTKEEFNKKENQTKRQPKGCTGPRLVPTKPFVVIWNVPSIGCDKRGIHFDFSDFGITANPGDQFFGKENLIFYNIGIFPRINKDGSLVNGGVPQQGDLASHLAKVVTDTTTSIPDVGFTGAGVLDFESWRPKWETDYSALRIYQAKSIALVKQQHPTWTNNTQIVAEAIKQFETGAREFMLGTLDKVRQLRPSGYFGYYGFPSCWGVPKAAEIVCPAAVTTRINDDLGWLFTGSNGLYPRIYFDPAANHTSVHNAIRRILNETARVQAKFSGLNTPILPYAIFQSGNHFFDKSDLDLAIREPADMGAAGVVFWGSSAMFHLHGECLNIQKYIKDVLGPYVKSTETFFEQCSQKNCNGNGRCVRRDYEALAQLSLQKNGIDDECRRSMNSINEKQQENEFSDTYVCRCFQGWSGPNCSS